MGAGSSVVQLALALESSLDVASVDLPSLTEVDRGLKHVQTA